jgi:hypothetical protein
VNIATIPDIISSRRPRFAAWAPDGNPYHYRGSGFQPLVRISGRDAAATEPR